MALTCVFDELEMDDAPMEEISFFAGKGLLRVKVDTSNGERVCVEFGGVTALRMIPSAMVGRQALFVDGEYRRCVLKLAPSPWVAEVVQAAEAAQEPIQNAGKLGHFLIPSDDCVWELIARTCRWVEGES